MPNKSFSIYPGKENLTVNKDDCLVLEIGKTHIACLHKKEHKHIISAFELFAFNENEAADFSKLFSAISADSKLLTQTYPTIHVFINNDVSILVPIFKFNTEIAADYLDLVFGEDRFCKIQFEHLPVEPGMMNVYRVEEKLLNFLYNNFKTITLRHTWSNIIKTVVADIFDNPSEYIYIQFYNNFFIVIVIKNEKVQIVQSFVYDAPEDVLYYLLNITERFELNNETLILQISGMIDLDFTLYRELITYFRHVRVQNVHTSTVNIDIKQYPLHYFTPFFNLAL